MAGHQVLVLRIGVRIPAPQSRSSAMALCDGIGRAAYWPAAPVVRSSPVRGVTLAPIVLILAAGQGTRMRSQTPKVLHDLCGRPMLLWPVHAALEAGAETGRGRRLSGKGARGGAAGGRRVGGAATIQRHRRRGCRGDRRSSNPGRATSLRAGTPVVVLSGDVPLVSAEAIRG